MNTNRTALFAALFLASISAAALASPRGGSNQSRDFLVGSSESDGWTAGAFYMGRDKDAEVDGVNGELSDEKYAVYVGHTLTAWSTVYGIAGVESASFNSFGSGDSNDNFVWGVGTELDLFSHEIQDPSLMLNQIRVNGFLNFYSSSVDALGEEQDMRQFDAALTVSLLNDLDGVALYMPESIAIFAGPMYSQVNGDITDDPDDNVGITAGLEVFQSKRVSYYARVDNFSSVGYAGGMSVRF